MKKIIYSLLIGWLIFLNQVLALQVSLNVNQNTVNINQPFQLTVKIISDKNWTIQIQWIKWLDNFEILWQSQYQSYSSNVVNINWQVKQQISTTYNVVLTLKPKKDGDFTLWPANIVFNWKVYKTNSIQIKVIWTKTTNIMLNQQNQVTYPKNTLNTQPTKTNQPNLQNNTKKQVSFPENKNLVQQNKNYWLVILIISLILIWLAIIYYLLKNNNEQVNFLEDSQKEKESTTESEIINKKDDFLSMIAEKYNIKNIYSKTFSEIVEEIEQQWKEITDNELKQLENILINKFKN